jgi:alpha-tubulin suppressor-like RCC1 family protein
MKRRLSGYIFLFLCISLLAACGLSDDAFDDEFDDAFDDYYDLDDGPGVPGRPAGYLVPTLVSSTLPFNTLESSEKHTCGVVSDGTTYCWGLNEYGELGSTGAMETCDLVSVARNSCTGTPQQVNTALKFVALSGSTGHGLTCGLTAQGEAHCWGFGLWGQLGNGELSNSSTPVAVAGGLQFASIRVGSGGAGVCGLTATSDLYCWGSLGLLYANGQRTEQSSIPQLVNSALGFISFDLGELHACGVSASGQAYCWGSNWYGQLGIGSRGSERVPIPTEVVGGHVFRSIVTGSNQSCALTETGEAYCWGSSNNIGSPASGYVTTPQSVVGGHNFLELSAGFLHTCGLTTDGAAYCWGQNYFGALGDGTQQHRTTPVKVQINQKFISLSHRATCGLTDKGQAYCWGSNAFGQVGKPPHYEIL